jgi:hypothetical protein
MLAALDASHRLGCGALLALVAQRRADQGFRRRQAINRFPAFRNKEYVTLEEWREIDATGRAAMLGRVGKGRFNKQENTKIEWADWSWNPVTGCLPG